MYDCVVIGGGPAGLTSAIYLARYHLKVGIFDDGQSRAHLIPLSRNIAGFPDGISGSNLLKRMREHATMFDVTFNEEHISKLCREGATFKLSTQTADIQAQAVVLATGVFNRRPAMSEALHQKALDRGLVRYCPICDGYEVTDQTIAVLGSSEHAIDEVDFIRSYTRDVTLILPSKNDQLSRALKRRLVELNVKILKDVKSYKLEKDSIRINLSSGSYIFQALYPALGSEVHSKLAIQAGVSVSGDGCVMIDNHQATNIDGLYAVGDVAVGLDQIANAVGHGSVAATAVRNYLAKKFPLLRK
jgi:thioredoxin reductase (NADPH)